MLKKILFLYLLFFLHGLTAQQKLDSLYGVWQDATQTDSVRVYSYNDYIIKGFIYSKPDSALILIEALHDYAIEKDYPLAAALGYGLQGYIYGQKSNFTLALDYNEKALTIFEEIGDKYAVANILNSMALTNDYQGNYPRALEYHKRALAIRQEIGNKSGIAGSMINIGIVKRRQGYHSVALDYYEKALAISEEIGDDQITAYTLNSIGIVYENQGDVNRAIEYYKKSLTIKEELEGEKDLTTALNNIGGAYTKLGNYTLALEYLEKSLAMDEKSGNKKYYATSLVNIGDVYEAMGNYTRALEYLEKALAIMEEIGDKNGTLVCLNNIGLIYTEQGNKTQALKYCSKSYALALEIEELINQQKACDCLYSNYKALGNSQKALEYHEQMLKLNDSLKATETIKKLEQMEFAKQVLADSLQQVEKDLQVEMVHQAEVRTKDRNRNLALGAGIFFLVLSGGFYSRWRYVRKSKKIIEKEKDRSENLLLNILPSEIAEELKLKGSVDARDFDQVSVLFTDFKGFTTRSEKLTARELVEEINLCFEAFDHICGRYKIEKIKTIGDAYMAGGGLPVPSEDAVKNTVLAALEMQAFMGKRAIEKEASNEIPFEMRVGIHTGPVVAGIVGVKKFQYDIWGDTVNTASRVESSGEVGKVNISQATYEIIKDDPQFNFEARGKIKAKGKGELEMFFVEQST